MNQDYNPEKSLKGQPKAIPFETMEALCELMKNRICKIFSIKDSYGTGFFCNIPLDSWNILRVLMTNNHVLNENDIAVGKIIKFTMKNDSKNFEILIDDKRIVFTDEKYDVTIIDI